MHGNLVLALALILGSGGAPPRAMVTGLAQPLRPSCVIAMASDTHWGGFIPESAADDIGDWFDSLITIRPDQVFLLGDVTEDGEGFQFAQAADDLAWLRDQLTIDRVWMLAGGAHDGLYRFSAGEWRMGWHRTLGNYSQWYTLKMGNCVFVMCGAFTQPMEWASGQYGGYDWADLMNQNKVDWLQATLDKYAGNNVFICRHYPLWHTNIYTGTWPCMPQDRFQYESELIKDILAQHSDVVAFFSGHVHVDSDARRAEVGCGDGTILPGPVTFVSVGDIWKEHGRGWALGESTFANFRILRLIEGRRAVRLSAWDANANEPAMMSVSYPGADVWNYDIPLPYPIVLGDLEYEQSWDVWAYSDEGAHQWYLDSEGLVASGGDSFESRWDLGQERDLSICQFVVDSSAPEALSFEFQWSADKGETWSEFYLDWALMPRARWLKVVTTVTSCEPVYVRDMAFIEVP